MSYISKDIIDRSDKAIHQVLMHKPSISLLNKLLSLSANNEMLLTSNYLEGSQ